VGGSHVLKPSPGSSHICQLRRELGRLKSAKASDKRSADLICSGVPGEWKVRLLMSTAGASSRVMKRITVNPPPSTLLFVISSLFLRRPSSRHPIWNLSPSPHLFTRAPSHHRVHPSVLHLDPQGQRDRPQTRRPHSKAEAQIQLPHWRTMDSTLRSSP